MVIGKKKGARVIEWIKINALCSADKELIKQHLQIKKGDPFNEKKILHDFSLLMELGYFDEDTSSVSMVQSEKGKQITFKLWGSPTITAINYHGFHNNEIKEIENYLQIKKLDLSLQAKCDKQIITKAETQIKKLITKLRATDIKIDLAIERVSRDGVIINWTLLPVKKSTKKITK